MNIEITEYKTEPLKNDFLSMSQIKVDVKYNDGMTCDLNIIVKNVNNAMFNGLAICFLSILLAHDFSR